MELYEEKICRYSLNRIFGYSPKTARALIENFGSASELFRLGGRALKETFPYTDHIDLIDDSHYEAATRELSSLERKGYRFISSDDPLFPQTLGECPDGPMGLYVRSESPMEDIFPRHKYISVIGTRNISPYGAEWCTRIVSALSSPSESLTIVSGLAIGIDITAHRTSLAHGTPTIAVLPTGIEDVSPSRHIPDARKIASTPGCALITDFPPGTEAAKYNFLRRNRIIAGLCHATILVESAIRGGGMMTARLAFSYSREVLAVPGRVDDIRSQGCNLLIREKIAEPIISEYSLADSLGIKGFQAQASDADSTEHVRRTYSGSLSSEDIDLMAKILLEIKHNRGITIEEISGTFGLGYQRAATLTGFLESDGIISTDLMRRCFINVK